MIPKYVEDVSSIHLSINKREFNHFRASQLEIKFDEKENYRSGKQLLEIAQQCLGDLKLTVEAENFALSVINTLIATEAKIHNTTPEKVHLHEAGSVDTLIDSIGSARALDELKLLKKTKWFVLPVAVGSGTIKFSHGFISAPAPATLEIISSNNIEITGSEVKEELSTPTGAAILASLRATSISRFQNMIVKSKLSIKRI